MGGQGFTGKKLTPDISDQVASKIQEVIAGPITTTYVAYAVIGSLQASAVWSCRKIVKDSGTGITVITWAEEVTLGPTERFVHVATDLTLLTYS